MLVSACSGPAVFSGSHSQLPVTLYAIGHITIPVVLAHVKFVLCALTFIFSDSVSLPPISVSICATVKKLM